MPTDINDRTIGWRNWIVRSIVGASGGTNVVVDADDGADAEFAVFGWSAVASKDSSSS